MKKAVLILLVLLAGAGVFGRRLWLQPVAVPELDPAQAGEIGVPLPSFREIPVDFVHRFAGGRSLPFAGAAVIDIDGDGSEEIFVAGGDGQDDALLDLRRGRLVDIARGTGLSGSAATYGALALDIDNDRDTDLVVARQDGLHLHRNDGRGNFIGTPIEAPIEARAVPVAITAADVNRDGHADLYVSTFINAEDFKPATFNDPAHATTNLLLLGLGDGRFRDGTEAAGLTLRQNTFLSVFVDLDNDGRQDLAVAQNTGPVAIFQNNADGTFARRDAPTENGYWMSLATGDYDADGDMDLFFSNIGNSIPQFLLTGDLRDDQALDLDWALLRNDGEFRFANQASEAGLAGLEFGWGAAFGDFNLDGRPDLVVAENYVKWPAHRWDPMPGRLMIQDPDGRFRPLTRAAGIANPHFGQAVLVSDLDGDEYPDIVFVNLDGPPRAYLNKGGKNRSVRVRFADNTRALGARVMVTRRDGRRLGGQVTAGVGFMSDQSPQMIFGLGAAPAPVRVDIAWPDGRRRRFQGVAPGRILTLQ